MMHYNGGVSRRYCITGAGGFVGANLVRALLHRQPEKLFLLVKPTTKLWRLSDVLDDPKSAQKIELVQDGWQDLPTLHHRLKRIKPEVIFHLAARGAYSSQNDPVDIMMQNVLGTLNLLLASQLPSVKLFVQTGSSSEYGFQSTSMREDTLPSPNSYYAVAKLAATHLGQLLAVQQHMPVVTLRLFSVYGPWEEPTRLMPSLLRALLEQKLLALTDPATARDFIYVDDVVSLMMDTKRLRKVIGEVVNVGTGHQTTLRELVKIAESVTRRRLVRQWRAAPAKTWDSATWVADMTKARTKLDWQPQHDLASGLAKMWAWFQAQRRV